MKKLIALVLALIMAFSACVVAFAADAEEPAPETGTTVAAEEEEGFDPMDIPAWTIGPGLKIAKIFAKLAKVVLKLALILKATGLADLLQSFIDKTEEPAPDDTAPEDSAPVETPAAPAADAA